ncbi:MAG: hypothetical protein Q7R57_00600, partial [Dehalococcoidales bacterium]|nr:hypothetical protein [Dehalococcoidales bacterium]
TSRRKLSLKGRLTYNPKVLGLEQSINEAWSSSQSVFSKGQVSIANFGAYCQIWSQAFPSGSEKFVLSFVFPEELASR